MYQKTTLENGLRIVTARMPSTPSLVISFFFGTGSRYESESEAGVSHFIEHLLFRGTEKRPTAREVSEAIEGIGGMINAGTDKELTMYWCKVPRPRFTLALDVLSDMVLHSHLKPQFIEKERQVIIEEINRTKDSPSQWANMLIDGLLWPGHPLGRDIAGNRDSVATISREAMLDYMSRHYKPGNTVISIAGDLEHDDTVRAVSQALAGWEGTTAASGYPGFQPQAGPKLQIDRRPTEQTHICIAMPGLSLTHPQRYTLDLLNAILGSGMSSRLFVEIRDHLGLAYSINSYVEHYQDTGALTIYAGTEPKNLPTAVEAIVGQLTKLREPVPEAELRKAKELLKGRLLMRMENSRNVAGWFGGQAILTGQIRSVEQVIDIIEAITAEEIGEVARDLLAGNQLRLAAVGPVEKTAPLEALLRL